MSDLDRFNEAEAKKRPRKWPKAPEWAVEDVFDALEAYSSPFNDPTGEFLCEVLSAVRFWLTTANSKSLTEVLTSRLEALEGR